jgi:predicted Zn-dependent peptidase
MKQATSWERGLLSNGLKVLYFPRPSDLTLRLGFAAKYGAHDDLASQAGLAHLVEHLLSAGSKTRVENAERIEHFGGALDLSTTAHYTLACAHIASDQMVDSSRVLSEIAFDGAFEPPKLQKERRVVLEEIAEQVDIPWHRVYNTLRKSLFGTHPAGRPLAGFRETVENLSLDSVVQTHHRYYHPQNIIVTLMGRYDRAETERALEHFRQPPTGKPRVNSSTKQFDRTQSRENEIIIEDPNIAQAYIAIGATTTPAAHPDSYALDIIELLLGQGATSRLYKEFREKQGLAYTVVSTHRQGLDYGFFAVWTAVKNRNVAKARRLFQTHFERIISERLSEQELHKGKEMAKGEILRALDDPVAGAETLVETEILYNDNKALDHYLQEVQANSATRVREVAAKYLGSERLVTVVLKPKGK